MVVLGFYLIPIIVHFRNSFITINKCLFCSKQTIISEAILATCGVNYCPEPTIEVEELHGPITGKFVDNKHSF